jgi:hypothetical protein
MINFYKNSNFILLSESKVVHGQEKWFDMKLILKTDEL